MSASTSISTRNSGRQAGDADHGRDRADVGEELAVRPADVDWCRSMSTTYIRVRTTSASDGVQRLERRLDPLERRHRLGVGPSGGGAVRSDAERAGDRATSADPHRPVVADWCLELRLGGRGERDRPWRSPYRTAAYANLYSALTILLPGGCRMDAAPATRPHDMTHNLAIAHGIRARLLAPGAGAGVLLLQLRGLAARAYPSGRNVLASD